MNVLRRGFTSCGYVSRPAIRHHQRQLLLPHAVRADGFDAIWKRYMGKAKAAAAAEGLVLEHFTEHDIRAKVDSDAVEEGREDGYKLLGNTPQMFRKAYDRGVESGSDEAKGCVRADCRISKVVQNRVSDSPRITD